MPEEDELHDQENSFWHSWRSRPLPAAAQQPGVTADKILLGQAAVFTGPAAQLGIQMRNGIKSYFDFVNEKGGVHGRKLELVTRGRQVRVDGGAHGQPGADRGAQGVRAAWLRRHADRAWPHLPVTTAAKVPLVGMFTGAEVLREPMNRYVFHVRASYYDETDKIVEQVVSTGGKKIAVFYQDDAYGEAGRKGTEIALTQARHEDPLAPARWSATRSRSRRRWRRSTPRSPTRW